MAQPRREQRLGRHVARIEPDDGGALARGVEDHRHHDAVVLAGAGRHEQRLADIAVRPEVVRRHRAALEIDARDLLLQADRCGRPDCRRCRRSDRACRCGGGSMRGNSLALPAGDRCGSRPCRSEIDAQPRRASPCRGPASRSASRSRNASPIVGSRDSARDRGPARRPPRSRWRNGTGRTARSRSSAARRRRAAPAGSGSACRLPNAARRRSSSSRARTSADGPGSARGRTRDSARSARSRGSSPDRAASPAAAASASRAVDAIGRERGRGAVVDAEVEQLAGVGIDLADGPRRPSACRQNPRCRACRASRDRARRAGRLPTGEQPVVLHDDRGVRDVGRLAEGVAEHAERPHLAEAAMDDAAGRDLVAVVLGRDVAVAIVDAGVVEADRLRSCRRRRTSGRTIGRRARCDPCRCGTACRAVLPAPARRSRRRDSRAPPAAIWKPALQGCVTRAGLFAGNGR